MRALLFLPLMSCATLDWAVFNPVHCTNVTTETCEDNDTWDAVCLTCDEPYDWQRDYPWMDGTLLEGESIRPVNTQVLPIRVETDDTLGELDSYFLPTHGEDPALANTTVIYNHGNYAGIEHYAPRVRMLHEAGYNVFVWDYRGYGKSEPATTPTPEQFTGDARLIRDIALDFVPDPDRVIVYANSLGAIPAVEMAVHRPPCALLLEAPWTSMSAVAESNSGAAIPESFFSEALYDNIHKIEGYPGPVFAMIGDEDNKFPVADVQRLIDHAPGYSELWVLPGVKHGIENVGVPEAGYTDYVAHMRSFLDDHAADCLAP